MTFKIKHEKFEGPLDVLVEMISREKLSITDISLARVTDDYIQYVGSLGKIDREALGEFLVVAAQLLLIKSRSLLPQLEFTPEETESIEDLENRLTEYQKIRELTAKLRILARASNKIYSRIAYGEREPFFYPPKKCTAQTLESVYRAFTATIPKVEKLVERQLKRIVSLEEKIIHIRSSLQEKLEHSFQELIDESKEKVEMIVSFLALLELARDQFLQLEQAEPFAEIVIKKISHESNY